MSIEWEPIAACSKADEGKTLLAQMGEATHKLIPTVSFIPTIEVNKVQNNYLITKTKIIKPFFQSNFPELRLPGFTFEEVV